MLIKFLGNLTDLNISFRRYSFADLNAFLILFRRKLTYRDLILNRYHRSRAITAVM